LRRIPEREAFIRPFSHATIKLIDSIAVVITTSSQSCPKAAEERVHDQRDMAPLKGKKPFISDIVLIIPRRSREIVFKTGLK
jgi:hypothetical protein